MKRSRVPQTPPDAGDAMKQSRYTEEQGPRTAAGRKWHAGRACHTPRVRRPRLCRAVKPSAGRLGATG